MIAAVGILNASVHVRLRARRRGPDRRRPPDRGGEHADPAARARGGPACGQPRLRGRPHQLAPLSSANGRRLPVSLKAVDAAYPLLGRVELSPPGPLADALRDNGAVVERAVLARLGAKLGDTVRLGDATVRLAAVVEREPDRLGGLFSIGPRVIVSDATLEAPPTSCSPAPWCATRTAWSSPPAPTPPRVAAGLKAAKAEAGWRVQASGTSSPRSPSSPTASPPSSPSPASQRSPSAASAWRSRSRPTSPAAPPASRP